VFFHPAFLHAAIAGMNLWTKIQLGPLVLVETPPTQIKVGDFGGVVPCADDGGFGTSVARVSVVDEEFVPLWRRSGSTG